MDILKGFCEDKHDLIYIYNTLNSNWHIAMTDCLLVLITHAHGEAEETMGESIRCHSCKS